ncbi:MAG: transglycosylase domain-containing protein [Deltaproteobacteria bacterium]|nr:transglycosylase domain-containing protein [Deltaproteobacteria bacterium]
MRARIERAALALGFAPVLAAVAFVAWPLPSKLLDRERLVSLQIADREGGTLRELRSLDDGRSVALPDETVPPRLAQAFIAAEDHRFGHHPGVDVLGIARAAEQDLRAGRIVSGASTIPQQLARMLVPRPRTLAGKVMEALWAIRLTLHLPRERVLLEYANRVALGESTFGAEAASQLYFGRSARTLSAGQAALLAGLACNPESHDPYRHPEAAKSRMKRVLQQMAALGFLNAEQLRVAVDAPVDLVPPERAFRSPHFVNGLVSSLPRLGLHEARRIDTTLDPALQADVEDAVHATVAELGGHQVSEAAAIVVDNATGEVLAYVGSADYLDWDHGGANDGVRALRQPGSALKPFAYGLALANGHTPAEVLGDVETHLATPTGDYVPRNYDRRVHGPVRLRAALQNSYNVPAVRIAETLGTDRVLRTLQRAGFESLDHDPSYYGVGLVLGDGDVSLWELARAYRGLANGGVVGPLVPVRRAVDAFGQPLPITPELTPHRFLPADATNLLTDILSDEAARAPAFGLDNALRLPFPVAAKTGTSRAYVDNWTAGFTRERTVAVWVGNFDGRPMRGVSGITGAGPLFKRVMVRAMRGVDPKPLVNRERLTEAEICPLSGKLAGPACPGHFKERFLPGTAPKETCGMHRLSGDGQAQLDVGPEFYAWAEGEGLSTNPSVGGASGVTLLSPVDGDEYLAEPGLPQGAQSIPVRALVDGAGALVLRVDGVERPFARPFVTRVEAKPGPHTLELVRDGATIATAHYRVRGGDRLALGPPQR